MKNKPIILFDGVCNLCTSSIQFVLKHEKNKEFRFASLQSKFGENILKKHNLDIENYDSIIFLENDNIYFKSSAALKIAKKLKFPFNIISIFIISPKFIRNPIYNFIAKNRYKWFGKKDVCFVATEELLDRFL